MNDHNPIPIAATAIEVTVPNIGTLRDECYNNTHGYYEAVNNQDGKLLRVTRTQSGLMFVLEGSPEEWTREKFHDWLARNSFTTAELLGIAPIRPEPPAEIDDAPTA